MSKKVGKKKLKNLEKQQKKLLNWSIISCNLDMAIIGARNLNNPLINPIIKLWIPKCFKEDKKLTNDKVE